MPEDKKPLLADAKVGEIWRRQDGHHAELVKIDSTDGVGYPYSWSSGNDEFGTTADGSFFLDGSPNPRSIVARVEDDACYWIKRDGDWQTSPVFSLAATLPHTKHGDLVYKLVLQGRINVTTTLIPATE